MKPGILVAKTVVVLPPDERGQQVVQRGDRPPPGNVPRHLQPLGVLVEHRVDDVDEGLVAREEAVPPGQQIALQPALALVLAENLHDPAVRVEVVVVGQRLGHPGAVGDFEHVLPAVGVGLVRADQAEVLAVQVHLHDVAEELAHDPRRLRVRGAGAGHLDGIVPEVGHLQILEQQAAVGVRVRAHALLALGRQLGQLRDQAARLVEQLFRLVALHPGFEDLHVPGLGHVGHRHLMRAPVTFRLLAIDFLRAGPALGAAENDHRPQGALGEAVAAGVGLNGLDLADDDGRGCCARSWCILAGSSPSTKWGV